MTLIKILRPKRKDINSNSYNNKENTEMLKNSLILVIVQEKIKL